MLAPRATSNSTTAYRPCIAAMCRGVCPSSSRAPTSRPPSTKALQVAVHPAAAAQWRGELEQLSLISRLKFSSCISLRTLTTSPAATRYINALFRAFSSSSSASSGALAGAFGKPRACKPLMTVSRCSSLSLSCHHESLSSSPHSMACLCLVSSCATASNKFSSKPSAICARSTSTSDASFPGFRLSAPLDALPGSSAAQSSASRAWSSARRGCSSPTSTHAPAGAELPEQHDRCSPQRAAGVKA